MGCSKGCANLRKHDVSSFGVSSSGRPLVVAYTEHSDSIRIIAARLATRAERELYEEGYAAGFGRISFRVSTLRFRGLGPREIHPATSNQFKRCRSEEHTSELQSLRHIV